MTGIDWSVIGQGLMALSVMAVGAFGVWKGHSKSDGKPPEDRPPPPNETKAKLDAIHDRIERLANRIDHHQDMTDDDRRDMNRQLDRIERSVNHLCDRVDSDTRIGSAIARLGRQEG